MSVTEVQHKMLIYLGGGPKSKKLLTNTDFPLNTPLSLLVALAIKAYLAEEQLRHLKSK